MTRSTGTSGSNVAGRRPRVRLALASRRGPPRPDAGEVLEEHAGGKEREVAGRARPGRERSHVVVGDDAVLPAEEVLDQDQHGLRKLREIDAG